MRSLFFLFVFVVILNGCRYNETGNPVTQVAESVPPVISAPAEGEIIYSGTELLINWNGFKSQKIRLELWKKKQYYLQVIATAVPNTGIYTWSIPHDTPSSVSYQVKLLNADNPDEFIFSGYFTIKPQ